MDGGGALTLAPLFFAEMEKKESFLWEEEEEAPISLALFSTKEQLKKQKGDCNRLLFSFPFLLRFVIGRAEMETERGEKELFRLTPFFHLEFNFPRWKGGGGMCVTVCVVDKKPFQ